MDIEKLVEILELLLIEESYIGIDTMYYIEGFEGSFIPGVGFSIYGRSKGPNVPTEYYILYYRTYKILNKNTILKFKRLYLYENLKKHS